MQQRCPRCLSEKIKEVVYLNSTFIVCNSCKYDERESCDVYPEERTSQKAKKEFSPYQTGGAKRSIKR